MKSTKILQMCSFLETYLIAYDWPIQTILNVKKINNENFTPMTCPWQFQQDFCFLSYSNNDTANKL